MRGLFKNTLILGITALAGLYLINPTAGILEFVPDNIPLVGNLDEVTAAAIVFNTLRYYGLDLTNLWGRNNQNQNNPPPPPNYPQDPNRR